ncbi:MAG: hypothetical protein CM15mP103_02540 [Gammaproteobacteria bacterium]|nr:MAG: hypothetical protein CM15mP103_02540 [Gammaproteobacteria bacterium]
MAVGDGWLDLRWRYLSSPCRTVMMARSKPALSRCACADESCQSSADLEAVADRYDAINIKLDKCGGLTDALAIREWCQRHGKGSWWAICWARH